MDSYYDCDVCGSQCGGMGGYTVPEGVPQICPALVKPSSPKIDLKTDESTDYVSIEKK